MKETNTTNLFPIRLREAIEESPYKQIEVANALGLNSGALSNYLNGRYEPRRELLCRLATLLNVSPSWLAGLSPDKHDRNNAIGKNMKARRLQLGISQEEMAVKLGYHTTFSVDKIEKGVNQVSINEMLKIADILQCSPLYLIGYDAPSSSDFSMSEKERQLVINYRARPEIQKAVDMLLGL